MCPLYLACCHFLIRSYYLPVISAINELDFFYWIEFQAKYLITPYNPPYLYHSPPVLCTPGMLNVSFCFPSTETRTIGNVWAQIMSFFHIFFPGHGRVNLTLWWSQLCYPGLIFSFISSTGLCWFPKSKWPTYITQLIYDVGTVQITISLLLTVFFSCFSMNYCRRIIFTFQYCNILHGER